MFILLTCVNYRPFPFCLVLFIYFSFFSSACALQMGSRTSLIEDNLRYVSFSSETYVQNYNDYLDAERFGGIPANRDNVTISDVHNSFDRDTVLCA